MKTSLQIVSHMCRAQKTAHMNEKYKNILPVKAQTPTSVSIHIYGEIPILNKQ